MGTILRHGSEEQKQRYLPGDRARRAAPAGVRRDRARRRLATRSPCARAPTASDDGGWLVNGQKIWTSRFAHSDLMLLLARTSHARPRAKRRTGGLSTFLVDLREAGDAIDARPIRTLMNHATVELFINDLVLPADALVGEEGKGFRYILDGMNAERILIAAECVGDGHWFIERATRLRARAHRLRPPDRPEPGRAVPARARLRRGRGRRAHDAGRRPSLFEAGQPCGPEANMAKLLASEASWEAANVCLNTHGGFGFAEEYDVERKFRENRLYISAPVHNNLILAYLGQHVLGMPKSY